MSYIRSVEIRWSDLDPNFHVRHSVYYDWGAYCRVCFLNENGFTAKAMQLNNVGPIIFREEAVFKREILPSDTIEIFLELKQCKKDFSKWTMVHKIVKNKTTIAAILTIDGAWLDTTLRKLTIPNISLAKGFDNIPKAEDFLWLD
jgi:acyl-CoA thioester hydrolase